MPAHSLPFLVSGLSFGVISAIIFVSALVILSIPVLGTRGTLRTVWMAISSILLLALAVTLITLTYLVGQGRIFQ